MRRPSTKVRDPYIPQLGLLDLLLTVSLPAHHHEIRGTWNLLDLVIWVFIQWLSAVSPPIVVCEKGEEEQAEGAERDDGYDICENEFHGSGRRAVSLT